MLPQQINRFALYHPESDLFVEVDMPSGGYPNHVPLQRATFWFERSEADRYSGSFRAKGYVICIIRITAIAEEQ